MRWEELSMSDRSNLMKAYLQNGVVRLSDMRDHYNKFADGGDAYIAKKAEEVRLAALERSRTMTKPIVPMVPNPLSQEDFEKNQDDIQKFVKKKLQSLEDEGRIRTIPSLAYQLKDRTYYADKGVENFIREINNPNGIYRTEEYQSLIPGESCMATASGTYCKSITGNQSFAADPAKYGFKRIPNNEILPGDIVQIINPANNIPIHAMIYDSMGEDGKPRYNYSSGGEDKTSVVKKGKYPVPDDKLHTYRFVGNHADSIRWKREYNRKAFGGPLRNEYDNLESPEEYATFTYKPTLRRVNSFDRGGAVDLPVRDSTQPTVRPIFAGNFQVQEQPEYAGPIVGEIRADERSKTQKFFDRVRTKYNTSSFGNSAIAEVLSATTPYGLIHEGMQGNTGSALMSIAPVGAVLQEGKVAANVARATYKAGKSIVSREQAQELAEHIFQSEKKKLAKELQHPNAEKKIKEFYKDHLQTDYTTPFNETNEIYVDPDILLDIDPIVTESTVDNIILSDFKARGTSYGEEVLKNLQKTPVVDNNLINRLNKIDNSSMAAAMFIRQDADQLVYRAGDQLPSGKILTSSDAEFLNEFHKKYAGRIVSTYGTDPKIFADYILHEISHQSTNGLKLIDYLDGRPLANGEFYPLLKLSLVDPKMANARYYENFTEKATRLKSVRRALEKRLKFSYLDTPIEQKHIDYLYNNYGKANIPEELTKSIERVTELYKRNPTKSTANYLNNKLEQYNNLILDFERSKLQATPMEGLTLYKQDKGFIDAINALPPLKHGGFLK